MSQPTICSEALGAPGDPPILLMMGQMASMLWWPDEFCQRLAGAGRFVIRYDNRDTGRSTSYEPGKPPYGPDELAGDAVRVLGEHRIERAHLVGMSMGGAIAQLVALDHPDWVLSLTAISTTKLGEPDPGLPGPTAEYLEHAATAEDVDWSDPQAMGEFMVRDARRLAGTRHPFDEAGARDLVARDLARAVSPQSAVNHAMLGSSDGRELVLGGIKVPLLVIHGGADPLFPFEHGAALAEAVPGAQLVRIEGGGHELHERDWDQILEAILAHTADP